MFGIWNKIIAGSTGFFFMFSIVEYKNFKRKEECMVYIQAMEIKRGFSQTYRTQRLLVL